MARSGSATSVIYLHHPRTLLTLCGRFFLQDPQGNLLLDILSPRDSGISQIIGPTSGMQQNALLFPFDCAAPAHSVHLQCLTRDILRQIQQPPINQVPIDLLHCSICGARLLLAIRNQMDICRTSGVFPFYLFPTINNRGGTRSGTSSVASL